MDKMIELIKKGFPIYLLPHKEPKVWGVGGIGEYWYGAEGGGKSSIAVIGLHSAPMNDLLNSAPETVLGEEVIERFGKTMPLVKLLTPKGRLSVQFHDAKNELWVVTGVDKKLAGNFPKLIVGFRPELVKKYGDKLKADYRSALETYGKALNALIDELERTGHRKLLEETGNACLAARKVRERNIPELLDSLADARKALEGFYNYVNVKVGDIIPVPQGTLHALTAGIEVVEPQIPGPTQSLEDGATYPVRYYFPDHPRKGAGKKLEIDKIGEMRAAKWDRGTSVILKDKDGVKVERLPGAFEDKGMEVHRIIFKKNSRLAEGDIKSFHTLVAVKGKAIVEIGKSFYDVPLASGGGRMLVIPASTKNYKIDATKNTEIIDTFVPA